MVQGFNVEMETWDTGLFFFLNFRIGVVVCLSSVYCFLCKAEIEGLHIPGAKIEWLRRNEDR